MSYELFCAAINERALREVAGHWNAVRRDRLMPAWHDIDPVALGRNLPIVWAWRYDAALGSFTGRLAGEEITAVLGLNIRGKPIEACFRPDAAAIVRQRYRALMDVPQLMHSHGKVLGRAGGSGYGERVVLPLADDGIHPDGVIGATVYRLAPTMRDDVAIDHQNESIAYYPMTG